MTDISKRNSTIASDNSTKSIQELGRINGVILREECFLCPAWWRIEATELLRASFVLFYVF